MFFFLFLDLPIKKLKRLQVSSPVEGPGSAAAETIPGRAEQIETCEQPRQVAQLTCKWVGWATWRTWIGQPDPPGRELEPPETVWWPTEIFSCHGELIVSFKCIRLQSILSIYNLILLLLRCLQTAIHSTWLLSTQWHVILLRNCWLWNITKDTDQPKCDRLWLSETLGSPFTEVSNGS